MDKTSDIDSSLHQPAKGASAAFAILFTASCGLHIWQSKKYSSWPYTWQLPCACVLMVAGFVCREYTAWHPHDDLLSAIQGLFYTATLVFSLPLYTFLLRLFSIPPTLVRIPHPIALCFLGCFTTAIITTTSQGAATYFSPKQSQSDQSSGHALIKASLILELFFDGIFVYMLALLQYRQKQRYQSEHSRDRKMMTVAATFYVLMALIVICNIWRTAQIFAKPTSSLWTSEAYFWVFEAILMLTYTVVFHVMHPAKYISMGAGTTKNTRRASASDDADSREM